MTPLIVGFGHKARTGKDTAAAYLVQKHGFVRLSFAYTLKCAASVIFGFDNEQLYGSRKELIDPQHDMSPREAFQKFGVGMRKLFGDDIWIRALQNRIDHPRVVISDVRFPNEAEAIRSWGGFVVRIDRGVPQSDAIDPAAAAHESETALDNYGEWDAIIENNGTLAEFYAKLDALVHDLAARKKLRDG